MKLRLILLSTLLLSLFALSSCGNTVAVVNSAKVFQESEAGKKAMAHLQSILKQLEGELKQAELDAQASENPSAKFSEFQQQYALAQQEFNAEQERVMQIMTTAVEKTVVAYREANKIDVIVDHEFIAAYDVTLDITEAIIAEMNKTPIEFTQAKTGDQTPEAPLATQNATGPGASTNSTLPSTTTNATQPASTNSTAQ